MRLAAACVVLALAAAGCGGGGGTTERVRSAQDVIDLFKKRTGEELVLDQPVPDDRWERLDLGKGTDPDRFDAEDSRLAKRFGAFTVYVIRPGRDTDKEIQALLEPSGDPDAVETVDPEPSTAGIYWAKVCYSAELGGGCSYLARKRFGANVLMTSVQGSAKRTDATFETVVRALADLDGN